MDSGGQTGFPPGEIGTRFNRIENLARGEFVYVRMQVWRDGPSELDSYACKLITPSASSQFADAFQVLWVPRSQIVCREPKVMEADGGVVRALEIGG